MWHATTEAEAGAGVEDEELGYEESPEEVRERQAVGALVRWCVERGAAGSGLSVLLPDGSGRGRGLEASRDLEVKARNETKRPRPSLERLIPNIQCLRV